MGGVNIVHRPIRAIAASGFMISASVLSLATILPASSAAATVSGKKTVVTVWSWFIKSTMDKAIAAFEKTHPNVVIRYSYYNYSPQYLTALKAAAASNTLPDIIGLQPGALTQQYRPYLVPLNRLAEKTWGKNWESRLYPVDIKQMTMGNPPGNSGMYIMPQESQVICLWYNTVAFKRLHLTVPTTLPELVHDAKVLSSHGYIPMYQGAAGAWQNENVYLMLADQLAPGLIDKAQYGKASWTSPALVKAMTVWGSLFHDGVFQSGALGDQAYPTGAQLFADGRVGIMALGSWWLQEDRYPPPLPPLVKNMKGFAPFYFPAIEPHGHPSPPVGGVDVGDGLTKAGAKIPAAWQFLASLVDGKGEQASLNDLNDLPAFKFFEPTIPLTAHMKSIYNGFLVKLSHAHNQRFAYPVIENAFDNALAAVAAGTESPLAALKKVQSVTVSTFHS